MKNAQFQLVETNVNTTVLSQVQVIDMNTNNYNFKGFQGQIKTKKMQILKYIRVLGTGIAEGSVIKQPCDIVDRRPKQKNYQLLLL